MPRLLLVEDEQANRELFRRRLERKGHAVVTAENGLEAVALARGEKPDLIIMDLGLPDIDGWEATRRLKAGAETAAIPVIVLSAHAGAEARERAFAAGCEDFETKPVDWDSLFRKIDAAIAKAAERAKAAAKKAAPDDDEIDFGGGGDADPAATLIKRGPKAEGEPPAPARVLVVEDNEPNRAMLCRRLHKLGHTTAEAGDGREALDAVRKEKFDLVLCDLMMPGVDGYEVLRQMKADADLCAIPVIVLSALDEAAGVARCIELGAEDYLHKPYDAAILSARINACLEKRRLRERELDFFRAVGDLTRAAEMLERGRFDPALLAAAAARPDALGTLARAFDRMAREVLAREQSAARPGGVSETTILPKLPR
jgi:CheY-like chemotaxis protein